MQLKMKPSTFINTANKTFKIHVNYDENHKLVVDCAPKHDFSSHFLD